MARKKAPTRKEQNEEIRASLVLLPAVAVLPMEAEVEQKVFFNPLIKAFGAALAKRGAKYDNGVTFVHDKFVNEFCDAFYKDLTADEREQYHKVIGYVSLLVSFLSTC